jgi:hypothetical protein
MESEFQLGELFTLKKQILNSKSLTVQEQVKNLSITFDQIYNAVTDNKVSILYRTNACDTLSIWLTRSLQLINKNKAYKAQFTEFLTQEKSDFLFHYVIDFWNDSGAALGNALKELFIKMLTFLSSVLDLELKNQIFANWLSTALDLPYTMRAFYFMIEHLHKYVQPVDFILNRKPNFVADCLENIWSRALGSVVGKCVVLVLRYNYSKDNEDLWLSLWKDQIINYLKNVELRKGIESYVLPNLFQVSKTATVEFLKAVIQINNTPILLSTLKVAQDSAILIEPFFEIDETSKKPLISIEEISLLLQVNTASYRISALQLLVSSPKLSKAIPSCIYEIVLGSLDMIFMDSDLETRNEMYSSFKKFISRIKDSTYALQRDATSLTKKNYEKFELEIKEKLNDVTKSKDFFIKLLKYIENALKPGSSYLKKEMAYKLLIVLIESGLDKRIDSKYLESGSKSVGFVYQIEIYNNTLVRLLIDNIMDNFEDIRHFSTEIITMASFKLEECIDMNLLELRALEMLRDIKGKEVDSGARFFKFAFEYYQNNENLIKCENIVQLLLTKIDDSLEKADDDFSAACIHHSIQGYFAAFKFIFEIINFSKFFNFFKENSIFEKLVNDSIRIWDVVKKILQHDSPEGILLDDFQKTYTKEMEDKYGKGTQVISSYAWRSVKESSNMIDSLLKLKKSPISNDLVLKVGPLLLEQLATIRHRGAFSSVYPTFISCCLLCSSRDELSQIPEQWLDENLNLIQTRSKYITRRSAGIPFLITAILGSNKSLVKPTFYKLLEVANQPVEEEDAVMDNINLPQVNAFNCIKTIFIDSTLSEESIYYVDDAFALTLRSFASQFWAIRNCAVMLFTALQNRLFSSKKVKANYLPSYPARLFFEKFESIHGLFLNTLKDAISMGLQNQSEIEKVFPILTIMSRLEPTPGYTGLNDFIPLVIQILENKTWKVREMAARSLPSMITSHEHFSNMIHLLLKNVVENDKNFNKIHGSLLAIKEIILKFMVLSSDESGKSADKLSENGNETRKEILSKSNIILNSIDCFPIKMTYFQIIKLMKINKNAEDVEFIAKLMEWFEENNQLGDNLDGSKQLALNECLDIILPLFDDNKDFIDSCIRSPLYEVQINCITYYGFKSESTCLSNEIETLLIDRIWFLLESEDVWNYVKSKALKLLKKLIIKSETNDDFETLQKHTIKLVTLLINESNADIRLSAIEALGSYIVKLMITDEPNCLRMFNRWIEILENMRSEDLEYVVRLAALKSLIAFNEVYSLIRTKINKRIELQIQGFLFEFLTDDDEEICGLASRHLSKFVLNKGDLEIIPVVVEKMMMEYFSQISELDLLEIFVQSKGFNFYDAITRFEDIVSGDLLLFSAEKSNLERNPTDKINELIVLINKTPLKSNTELLKPISSILKKNLDDIFTYLTKTKAVDGCFGLFSSERVFDFIYCQLLLFRCLENLDIINYNIQPLRDLLKLDNFYCHPLILETL